jgi:hypothetical protein
VTLSWKTQLPFSPLAIQIQDHDAIGCYITKGISAFIDDTGLFADGHTADLVIHDTIIFDLAGISLCIDKSRFLVSGTILHPPPCGHTVFRVE